MKKILFAGAALAALTAAAPSNAATFVVSAVSNVNTGLPTITLAAGQSFTISSNPLDMWAAHTLFGGQSNADGLNKNYFAQAGDDSGAPIGTQIGQYYAPMTKNGFTASYGQLVGLIGGQYIALGANGTYTAPTAGVLQLLYWDDNGADNVGSITFNVTAVPEPATWAMMIAGFGLVGAGMRRRKPTTTVAYA